MDDQNLNGTPQYHELYWKMHTPAELEAKIRERPITEGSLCALLVKNLIHVSWDPMAASPKYGLTTYDGIIDGLPKYHMMLDRLAPLTECMNSLSHELTRVHYCCSSPLDDKNHQLIEGIIEREALAAVKRHPLVIGGIFIKFGGMKIERKRKNKSSA